MIQKLRLDRRSWLRIYHEAAIEQLAREISAQGYCTTREKRIGKHIADLVAEKEDATIVYEVKVGDIPPEGIERLTAIKATIEAMPNTMFKLVFVSISEKSISIDGIEDALFAYFEDDPPTDIISLASHQYIQGVSDVDLSSIQVDLGGIRVKGDGLLSIQLQYGSNADVRNDDGLLTEDSLPFDFECVMDHGLNVSEMVHIHVDVSSFYE